MDNKDLIRQYVDTGLSLPEYQFNQLSNNDKRTYIRKRLIAQDNEKDLEVYEFKFMDNEEQKNYIRKHNLNDILFSMASPEIRDFFLDQVLGKGVIINPDWYWYLSKESKLKYLRALATKTFDWQWFLDKLSPEELEYYNNIKYG